MPACKNPHAEHVLIKVLSMLMDISSTLRAGLSRNSKIPTILTNYMGKPLQHIYPNAPSENVSPLLTITSAIKKLTRVAAYVCFLGILRQIIVEKYLVSKNLCDQTIGTELPTTLLNLLTCCVL